LKVDAHDVLCRLTTVTANIVAAGPEYHGSDGVHRAVIARLDPAIQYALTRFLDCAVKLGNDTG